MRSSYRIHYEVETALGWPRPLSIKTFVNATQTIVKTIEIYEKVNLNDALIALDGEQKKTTLEKVYSLEKERHFEYATLNFHSHTLACAVTLKRKHAPVKRPTRRIRAELALSLTSVILGAYVDTTQIETLGLTGGMILGLGAIAENINYEQRRRALDLEVNILPKTRINLRRYEDLKNELKRITL